jgi:hypothetical protein
MVFLCLGGWKARPEWHVVAWRHGVETAGGVLRQGRGLWIFAVIMTVL